MLAADAVVLYKNRTMFTDAGEKASKLAIFPISALILSGLPINNPINFYIFIGGSLSFILTLLLLLNIFLRARVQHSQRTGEPENMSTSKNQCELDRACDPKEHRGNCGWFASLACRFACRLVRPAHFFLRAGMLKREAAKKIMLLPRYSHTPTPPDPAPQGSDMS